MLDINYLNTLCRDIHAENVARGWWTNLATGESILETRNRGELLMLVVSELSEADMAEGFDKYCPQFTNYDIELADAAIRVADICGAEGVQFTDLLSHPVDHIMELVNLVSDAMEDHRKGRMAAYHDALRLLLSAIFDFATDQIVNLPAAIEAKRAFNRVRADHDIKNRQGTDGKKY